MSLTSIYNGVIITLVGGVILWFIKGLLKNPRLKQQRLKCMIYFGWWPKVRDTFKLEFINKQGSNICCCDKNAIFHGNHSTEFFIRVNFRLIASQVITISNITLSYPYPEDFSYPGRKIVFINREQQELYSVNLAKPIDLVSAMNFRIDQYFRCSGRSMSDNFDYQKMLIIITFSISGFSHYETSAHDSLGCVIITY